MQQMGDLDALVSLGRDLTLRSDSKSHKDAAAACLAKAMEWLSGEANAHGGGAAAAQLHARLVRLEESEYALQIPQTTNLTQDTIREYAGSAAPQPSPALPQPIPHGGRGGRGGGKQNHHH